MILFEKNNQFNIANIITYLNITMGIIAISFIVKNDFYTAIILAWIAGIFDILDGKIARKFNLSTEFGIQLDSFADFISFVIVPSFLLFYAIQKNIYLSNIEELILSFTFIWYIISGLRRLIIFNLKVDVGEVEKYFEGVTTPLGAILLWIIYLFLSYQIIENIYTIILLVFIIAYSLNSKIKIRHP